jgi:hypothetical protein
MKPRASHSSSRRGQADAELSRAVLRCVSAPYRRCARGDPLLNPAGVQGDGMLIAPPESH